MVKMRTINTDGGEGCRDLYLDILKKCLMNTIYEDSPAPLYIKNEQLTQHSNYSTDNRLAGQDWPSKAHTMIGAKRLNNIQTLAADVLRSDVEGDFMEAGVWRGGTTIFMRGILKAHNIENRSVWVADSFCGFPSRDTVSERSYSSPGTKLITTLVEDKDPSFLDSIEMLKRGTRLEDVKKNFERYGLLDDQVQFLEGYFHNTLPLAPIKKLAVLRADGDLYDSTYQILENLYPKVSIGGYVIIDDYYSFLECRQAVQNYMDSISIQIVPERIDEDAIFWQKKEG